MVAPFLFQQLLGLIKTSEIQLIVDQHNTLRSE